MADISFFFKKYDSFKSTLKNTSFDCSNKEYLCTNETEDVIDFDGLIKKLYPNSYKRPKSFDALYVLDNRIYLIEFKNQKYSDVDGREIREKLTDGKKELIKQFKKLKIPQKKYEYIYCVVLKNCKEPIERYKMGIEKGVPRYYLSSFKEKGFVTEVYTESVSFYTKTFKKIMAKEMIC